MAVRSQAMKAKLTVRYRSGREEQYEIELWGGAGMRAQLKEFIQSPNLAMQLNDELIVIPATAIESISLIMPKEKDWTKELSLVLRAKRLGNKSS
jgi:hypothetical protein